MSKFTQLIDDYLAGPGLLRASVRGLTREQLLLRPVAGKWSTLEAVCHLADFDPINADRMKRIIAEDRPTILGADENRFAAVLAYHNRDVDEELTIIEATRSQLAKILRASPEAVLQRVGLHNERGAMTLEQLLTITINHLLHHLKHINEKRQALAT